MNHVHSHRTVSALAFLFSLFFISTLCFAAGITAKMNVSQEPAKAPELTTPQATATVPAQEILSRQSYPNEITVAKLANGLTVIVQENHTAPVATVRCSVKNTGSVNETKYLGAGLSHVLEHVVAGGSTTKRSEKEVRDLIDTFGGVTNAYTSLDVTSYFIDCPAKNVETCVELVADQMQHAAFVPAEFDRELEVVQRELADGEENRARVMWKLAQETIYQESPAHLPIIGYLDVLKQMKREQIIDFYRERYIPNNMVFVVCGDVQTDAILNQVAREFAATPRGFDANVFVKPEPAQISPREAVREMDGSTTDVLLAFPGVDLYSQDLFTLDLLAYILSEGDSSRMVRDMQYDQSLVLSVGTSSYTPTFARGYFAVRMSVLPQNEQKAIETALNHLYRLRVEPVSAEELAKAKKQKASELIFEHQTVQQQAESLASSYMATGSPMFDEAYVAGLQKVTAEQIMAAANKYFRPEVLTTIKIVPQGTLAAREKAQKAEQGAKDVQQFTLPNGLTVLIKRDTHLPMVDMKIYAFGGDLFDSEETAGRASFIAGMLDKGTPTRSAEEITSWFDSVGGYFSFSSGRNTYSGGFSVLKEDYPQALEIVADCWQNATFPKEKFEQVKTLILGSIARRKESPQAELFETWADALPKTTPFHLTSGGKLETVSQMTPESLRTFFRENVLDPENSILTLYGDLDEAEAKNLVTKYFGAMPKFKSHETVDFARSNAIPENVKIHKVTGKETGMVLISFAAPAQKIDEKELMAVRLLNAVMGGYGYPGGWLHEELRGEGLVYAVHCVTRSGVVPGYMIFIAQTSPDKVEEVVGRLFKNIEKAKTGQITPEELSIAKQKLCALHAQSDTTIGEQATQQGLNVLYGLGIDFDRTYDDRVNATTLEDVIAAARKFLGGNYVQVTTSNHKNN